MSTPLKFIKADIPPATWLPDAVYFIKSNGYAESYVTSMEGIPEEIGNTQMIEEVVDTLHVDRFGIEDNTGDADRSIDLQANDLHIFNGADVFIGSTGANNIFSGIHITPDFVDLYSDQGFSPDNISTKLTLTPTDAVLARPGKAVTSLVTLADVQKNVPNGYAGLDGSGKVAAAQLPAYVDDVQEFSTLSAFPSPGTSGIIYVATDTNKTFRWSGTGYIEISPSPGSTDSIPEGSVNLYYQNARVAAVLTAWPGSSNINTVGTITAGTWAGTPVADNYVASASAWNGKQNALGFTPENSANKNINNGYAGLDGSAKIPASLLPAYVDDVLEYAALGSFPATGVQGIIYIALDTNKTYRWSGSAYVEISPSPGSTDSIAEGAVNKYYTDARVNTVLTTWTGNTAINKVGTIGTGTWQGTAIADTYIASAATWNNKADKATVTGTTAGSYVLLITDAYRLVSVFVSAPATITVPPNSSVAYANGTTIHLIATGVGLVTIVAGSGVTISSADGAFNLRTTFSSCTLCKIQTDLWYMWGDLI